MKKNILALLSALIIAGPISCMNGSRFSGLTDNAIVNALKKPFAPALFMGTVATLCYNKNKPLFGAACTLAGAATALAGRHYVDKVYQWYTEVQQDNAAQASVLSKSSKIKDGEYIITLDLSQKDPVTDITAYTKSAAYTETPVTLTSLKNKGTVLDYAEAGSKMLFKNPTILLGAGAVGLLGYGTFRKPNAIVALGLAATAVTIAASFRDKFNEALAAKRKNNLLSEAIQNILTDARSKQAATGQKSSYKVTFNFDKQSAVGGKYTLATLVAKQPTETALALITALAALAQKQPSA